MTTAPLTSAPLTTAQDLSRMSGLGPCELVRGRILFARPTSVDHGGIEGNFYHEIRSFVLPRGLGRVRVGEVGIVTRRDPDTVRGADVLFISNERYAKRERGKAFLDVAPELVVEVLSPSESTARLEEKLAEYFGIGVRLVWVADPEERTVRAYRSPEDVSVLREDDVLSGEDVLPGFLVPIRRLFEE